MTDNINIIPNDEYTNLQKEGGYSYSPVTGDDETLTWLFAFTGPYPAYLSTDDISVWVRISDPEDEKYGEYEKWVESLTFHTPTSLTTVTPLPATEDGEPNVRIRRIMQKDTPYANTFTDAIFRKDVLNYTFLQQLYVQHEVLDGYISVIDTGIIGINVTAPDVSFNPTSTGFKQSNTDVDKILREIDSAFVRYSEGGETDPEAPDGTPLEAHTTWLADSQEGPRFRPLPLNPADNDKITIRDDAGYGGTNQIIIGRNGRTIMGLREDLIIKTNWSWVALQWFSQLNDWRVIGGGVGAQVRVTLSDELRLIYPVGSLYFSTLESNPLDLLGFGTWQPYGEGRVPVGVGQGFDGRDTVGFDVNQTGGEYNHLLTVDEMPQHNHETSQDRIPNSGTSNVSTGTGGSNGVRDSWVDLTLEDAGGSQRHNNLQPYIGIYMWLRTA